MSIPGLLFGLVLLGVVIYLVLRPILSANAAVEGTAPASTDDLVAHRDAIYAAIREVDLDFQTGKITEADHTTRREQLVQQGIAVLKALDGVAPDPDAAPAADTARDPKADKADAA
jgi:hypothetical protein